MNFRNWKISRNKCTCGHEKRQHWATRQGKTGGCLVGVSLKDRSVGLQHCPCDKYVKAGN